MTITIKTINITITIIIQTITTNLMRRNRTAGEDAVSSRSTQTPVITILTRSCTTITIKGIALPVGRSVPLRPVNQGLRPEINSK